MSKTIRPTVYESAVDLWILVMILLSPLAAVVMGALLLARGDANGAMILFLVGAGALLLTIAFTVPCRYTILSDALSIRCGLICYQIPLADIDSIERSGSWLSGPALSLRRVKISTKRRSILVSPRERDGFIADLSAACDVKRGNGLADAT